MELKFHNNFIQLKVPMEHYVQLLSYKKTKVTYNL